MLAVDLYQLVIPMQCEFNHARSARHVAESLILTVRGKGYTGIGECVPRQYLTGETMESVIADLRAFNIAEFISTIDVSDVNSAIKLLFSEKLKQLRPNARCLIDLAFLDWFGKFFKKPIYELLTHFCFGHLYGNTNQEKSFVTTQVMDFSLSPEDFISDRGPFHYIKVKVGADVEENVSRVAHLRSTVSSNFLLSIDANMCWTLESAIHQIKALEAYGIDWIEEPLAQRDFAGYKSLREKTGCRVLMDESVCTMKDLVDAVEHKACDAVNIRVSKCGGLIAACEMISYAEKHGLSYQIGAQVAETGPLIAAGRHLRAVATRARAFEAGQPDRFFTKDYIVTPMPLVDRRTNIATVSITPGLGIQLTPSFFQFVSKHINLHSTYSSVARVVAS